jgi:hypothetical protein
MARLRVAREGKLTTRRPDDARGYAALGVQRLVAYCLRDECRHVGLIARIRGLVVDQKHRD